MQVFGWKYLRGRPTLCESPASLRILVIVPGETLNILAIDSTMASGFFNLASITLSLGTLVRCLAAHLWHRVE